MAITEMSLIKINGYAKDLDETMIKCCECGMFHPEKTMTLEEYTKCNNIFLEYSKNTGYLRKIVDLGAKLGLNVSSENFPQLKEFENDDKTVHDDLKKIEEQKELTRIYQNPYKELLDECEDISLKLNFKLKEFKNTNFDISLPKMVEYLKGIKSEVERLLKEQVEQEKNISEFKSVLVQLDNINDANIDFDELFSCKYLKIRFGRLPKESYEKLKIFDNEDFMFFSFKIDDSYSWCLYITPCYCSKKIDEMFASLFFERVRIPVYAHGTPDSTRHYVKSEIIKYEDILNKTNLKIKQLNKDIESKFFAIYSKVKFFSECFENKKYAAVSEGQFYIIGFIPKEYERKFLNQFKNLANVDITIYDPMSDKRLNTPVKLKNNKFSKPFEEFVSMYGLPSYKDVDPTTFLSIAYTLLFGIMFGDIGQGLLIALVGNIMWKFKKSNFGRILTRIGFSSAFFGVIYGSCFGYEELFEKYINLIPTPYNDILLKISHKDTNTLLLGAIFIGVIAIICSMLFNIVTGIKRKKSREYFFGQNGLAGLIFYSSVMLAAVGTVFLKINILTPWFIIFFIILPIILIFLKEPLGDKFDGRKIEFHDGVGGFIIESFFELYDVLLSFITNTISFIRVGAFILSHAGMMMVVMSFVKIMPTYSGIAVLIFGNIFVVVFEGLIVGIQVLRLQFYEMFSRCFDGAGKPFKNI